MTFDVVQIWMAFILLALCCQFINEISSKKNCRSSIVALAVMTPLALRIFGWI